MHWYVVHAFHTKLSLVMYIPRNFGLMVFAFTESQIIIYSCFAPHKLMLLLHFGYGQNTF